MPTGNGNREERSESEWEKCLESVKDFDNILIDLRKYGFTFISALIGSEVFFGLALGIQNAILLTIATIIVVLYWLDLYYRNALTGGLIRSIFLEMFRLESGMTYIVSSVYAKTKSEYYIVVLYGGLFLTAIFVATTVNTPQTPTKVAANIAAPVAQLKLLASNLTQPPTDLKPLASNLTQLANNLTKQAANITQPTANTTSIISNIQVNSEILSTKTFEQIMSDLYFSITKPFVLSILLVGIGFIVVMYLTSRKRRRTFSQMIRVFDYCYTLGYESGLPDLARDVHRVVMKILQEKDKTPYFYSLPLGYPKKIELHSNQGSTFKITKGDIGTLFLAERKTMIFKNSPGHYWFFISQIGILMLNTIGTFDRHQRPEVYRFAWHGETEIDLRKKVEEKKIKTDHCDIIAQLYTSYED